MEVFEMLVVPEHTYPLICVAVSKGTELNQVVRFGALNPNATSSWFNQAGRSSCFPARLRPLQQQWFEVVCRPLQTRRRRV